MKKILHRVQVVLCGLAFVLLGLEIFLRILGAGLLYLNESSNTVVVSGDETVRILCLGESTTFRRYPPYIEGWLKKFHPELDFRVIDEGRPGINSDYILDNVRDWIDKYNPDVVTAMMGCNDAAHLLDYGDVRSESTLWFMQRIRIFYLFRLLWWNLFDMNSDTGSDVEQNVDTEPEDDDDDETALGVVEYFPEQVDTWQKVRSVLEGAPDYLPHRVDDIWDNIMVPILDDFVCGDPARFAEVQKFLENDFKPDEPGEKNLFLGAFFVASMRFEEARGVFDKLVDQFAKTQELWIRLEVLNFLCRKWDRAFECAEQVSLLNEHRKEKHFFGVNNYFFKGELSEEEVLEYLLLSLEHATEETRPFLCLRLMDFYLRYGEDNNLALKFLRQSGRADSSSFLKQIKTMLVNLCSGKDEPEDADRFSKKRFAGKMTKDNYLRLHDILAERSIPLVCISYPMQSADALKEIFRGRGAVVFVDNQKSFFRGVRKDGFSYYFDDNFGGDFGHTTEFGSDLLAKNIATVISRHILVKRKNS